MGHELPVGAPQSCALDAHGITRPKPGPAKVATEVGHMPFLSCRGPPQARRTEMHGGMAPMPARIAVSWLRWRSNPRVR